MVDSAKVAPPYSLVIIEDPSGGEVPDTMPAKLCIASTDSCIAVGCLAEVDGETAFTLGEAADVNPGFQPAFDGRLKTPSRKVSLQTVERHTILEAPVQQQETRVRVWTNDPKRPDEVIVGIGE